MKRKKSKVLLSGDEALARGAWEAGVRIATGYPGTPSTGILEALARYPEVHAEWAPNEKVALEVAMGASFEGSRAITTLKCVGFNVAADPFVTFVYTGLQGGFVMALADDPGAHSSQNEQDSRHYARLSHAPLLEPSDSEETRAFTKKAYAVSEAFDTPVIVRITTRIAHTRGLVAFEERKEFEVGGCERSAEKYVMLPVYARARKPIVLKRLKRLRKAYRRFRLNRIIEGSAEVGILSAGVVFQYAREVIPWASFLKLDMTYPLDPSLVLKFAERVKRLIVVEELDPFIEEQVGAMGLPVEGKELFPSIGEFGPDVLRSGLERAGVMDRAKRRRRLRSAHVKAPRPPVLCPGCPHRSVFHVLKRLKAQVHGDIGCYTLGALPPLEAMHTDVCMGAGIGNACGAAAASGSGKNIVAVIGDSTFLHSGITPLMHAAHHRSGITVVILDNRTVAMTGGQETCEWETTLNGSRATPVSLMALCQGLGVKDIVPIDPYDYKKTYRVLKDKLFKQELSVVISDRPCVLFPRKIKDKAVKVDLSLCNGCGLCLELGCPALIPSAQRTSRGKTKVMVEESICTGCGVCVDVCKRKAITYKS